MPPSPAARLRGAEQRRGARPSSFIVVLNDNEWSIDKNVGAIATYFNAIADPPDLRASARQGGATSSRRSPARPRATSPTRSRKARRTCFSRACIFEEFGLRYYGPIDGHDLPLLIKTFEFLKTQHEPVAPAHHHGKRPRLRARARQSRQVPRPRQIQDRRPARPTSTATPTYSRDLRPHASPTSPRRTTRSSPSPPPCPAAPAWTFSRRNMPDRYFDVGIAEEHAALFACGLATQGFKPFLTIYSHLHAARLRHDHP